MKRYRLSELADLDMLEIGFHIGLDSPTAADRFVDLLHTKFALLADAPGAGFPAPNVGASVRCFVVGDYLIFYAAAQDGIDVLRVLHGHRDLGSLRLL